MERVDPTRNPFPSMSLWETYDTDPDFFDPGTAVLQTSAEEELSDSIQIVSQQLGRLTKTVLVSGLLTAYGLKLRSLGKEIEESRHHPFAAKITKYVGTGVAVVGGAIAGAHLLGVGDTIMDSDNTLSAQDRTKGFSTSTYWFN